MNSSLLALKLKNFAMEQNAKYWYSLLASKYDRPSWIDATRYSNLYTVLVKLNLNE